MRQAAPTRGLRDRSSGEDLEDVRRLRGATAEEDAPRARSVLGDLRGHAQGAEEERGRQVIAARVARGDGERKRVELLLCDRPEVCRCRAACARASGTV